MDFQQNDNSQPWAWQGYDLFLQADSPIEDISYMFDDTTTPVKSCRDFDYHFDNCTTLLKTGGTEEGKDYCCPPPAKRRRVLDFNNSDSEEISSSFLKSKETIDIPDVVLSDFDCYLQDDFFPPVIEDFGQSAAWLADCLNDTNMNITSDNRNNRTTRSTTSVTSTVQNTPISAAVRTTSGNIMLKGRKAYMRTPAKSTASFITSPFGFIKPCSIHGDVTLNDINQRIRTPPPKPKPMPVEEEDMISAFSGKPVVGKTKIPTRGAGCITIMRTKG